MRAERDYQALADLLPAAPPRPPEPRCGRERWDGGRCQGEAVERGDGFGVLCARHWRDEQ